MDRILLTLITSIFLIATATAQGTYQPKTNNGYKGVVYNKEFTVDVRLHTNGLAVAANIAKIKSYNKTKYYHFEIGELKHEKEYRYSRDFTSNNFNRSSSSYVFGKQNSLFVLRGGLGTKKYFSEKAKRKGLAIGMSYEYGPSLGFLKPYYLDIYPNDSNSNNTRKIKFSAEEAANFLDADRIAGYSGFAKGIKEVSLIPGIHGKFGFHFDWGAFDEYVKAVEVGIMADIYLKTVPLMVDDATLSLGTNPPRTLEILPENVRNRPFFLNLYISLQLGKRW